MQTEITKADITRAVYMIDENRSATDFAVKDLTKKNINYLKENNLETCKPVTLWQLIKSPRFWLKVLNYILQNHQTFISIIKKIK